ncbi:DUF1963 domain-containing protein [Corallococcus sp. H22C18031201]|nr:DUF1963 domain-containing protein [Corallococcus sp. H22C18031201]
MRQKLEAAGLANHADALLALVRPAIRLESQAIDDEQLPVGATKLGGRPDLPVAHAWPRTDDGAQAFIAQVNFEEVQGFAGAELLPRAGLLSFFYDVRKGVWGFDPKDNQGWTLLFTPPEVALQRASMPADVPSEGRFHACQMRPKSQENFAPLDSEDVERLPLTEDERSAYNDVLCQRERGWTHKLLGHPDPVQFGDMRLEAQYASNGIYCGGSREEGGPITAELRAGISDWVLLLQIDTDEGAGMMWGDVGTLYVWIREKDLATRQFGRSWLILQCC